MMRAAIVASLLLLTTGVATVPMAQSLPNPLILKSKERPALNLPRPLRQKNWLGRQWEGSCVHASWIMLLRWQNKNELADYWRRKYGDGEYYTRMASRLNAEGVRWAGTYQKNDVKFLEWAVRTRRGCMVTVDEGAHMVVLVHLDGKEAGILDNNFPDRIKWVPRNEFLSEWKAAYSWAMTPVYTPPPPLE